jgi:hypothetical protein
MKSSIYIILLILLVIAGFIVIIVQKKTIEEQKNNIGIQHIEIKGLENYIYELEQELDNCKSDLKVYMDEYHNNYSEEDLKRWNPSSHTF